MKHVVLVHWNEKEIPERAARLQREGFKAVPFDAQGGGSPKSPGDNAPVAFVIDLSRLPSHGRTVAVALRQQKRTRTIPLVFVDGEVDKIARVRKELPDAIYTDWPNIGGAMKKALAWKNENPVNPGATAGYSGTPLPKKLGVDGDRTVALIAAPPNFEKTIGLKKGDGRIVRAKADVVMFFVKTQAELKGGLTKALRAMADGGGLWIAWPKKASGVASDLSEDLVRHAGLKSGVVDYKVCAIDNTWSGLKFARRKK